MKNTIRYAVELYNGSYMKIDYPDGSIKDMLVRPVENVVDADLFVDKEYLTKYLKDIAEGNDFFNPVKYSAHSKPVKIVEVKFTSEVYDIVPTVKKYF